MPQGLTLQWRGSGTATDLRHAGLPRKLGKSCCWGAAAAGEGASSEGPGSRGSGSSLEDPELGSRRSPFLSPGWIEPAS